MVTLIYYPVYEENIRIINFNPELSSSEFPEKSREYLHKWCRDWNFKNGTLLVEAKERANGFEFKVKEVLDEIPNQ